MKRAEAVREIGTLLDSRCTGCLTKANLTQVHGNNFSHIDTNCNRNCEVGQRLQELGRSLTLRARQKIKESHPEAAH